MLNRGSDSILEDKFIGAVMRVRGLLRFIFAFVLAGSVIGCTAAPPPHPPMNLRFLIENLLGDQTYCSFELTIENTTARSIQPNATYTMASGTGLAMYQSERRQYAAMVPGARATSRFSTKGISCEKLESVKFSVTDIFTGATDYVELKVR